MPSALGRHPAAGSKAQLNSVPYPALEPAGEMKACLASEARVTGGACLYVAGRVSAGTRWEALLPADKALTTWGPSTDACAPQGPRCPRA